jgi:hypothetical protein
MFRFTKKPSSGSHSQYLAKITSLVQCRYWCRTYVVSVMAAYYSCPILMKLVFSQQLFENYSKIKFHLNPSSDSWVVPHGQTDKQIDMTKLTVAFRNFANASKSVLLLYTVDTTLIRIHAEEKYRYIKRTQHDLITYFSTYNLFPENTGRQYRKYMLCGSRCTGQPPLVRGPQT